MEGFLHEIASVVHSFGNPSLCLVACDDCSGFVWSSGKTLDQLLVYSQVFLSIALPFSIFPLIYLTSKKSLMGEFTNAKWNTILGYIVSIILTILNVKLLFDIF